MKKLIACIAVLALMLCGCAELFPSRSTLPSVVESVPEDTKPVSLPESPAPTGNAIYDTFGMVLTTIRSSKYLPFLVNELDSDHPIEEEDFAICDVDGDGKEELLVRIVNTYTAGMVEVIYGFNEETGGLYCELAVFPALTFYPGIIKKSCAHNQGLAGDALWPYFVYTYDAANDCYEDAAAVDAWSKAVAEKDWAGTPFPDDVDTDHTGVVYLILEGLDARTLSYSDYLAWEAPIFAGLKEIEIPWQKMTQDNVAAVGSLTEIPVADYYRWRDEYIPVTISTAPGELRICRAVDGSLLVSAQLPEEVGTQMNLCSLDDLNGDGYSDVNADFMSEDGGKASILWMSDGENLYYNEEFSILPGQVGPRGEE